MESAHTVPVPGASQTEIMISNLMASTTYSIQVAAVNSVGTGVYSISVIQETEMCELIRQ